MRDRLPALILAVLSLLLVFILFVPVVRSFSGVMQVCSPQYCIDTVQYTSISYAYGGWGAVFHTVTNSYSIDNWFCTMACSPAYGGTIWFVVWALLLVDSFSVILIVTRRPS